MGERRPFALTNGVGADFGETVMLSAISRTWWLAALRGALAIVFGVAAFVSPGLTFDVLVLLFGAYAFVDGVIVLSFGLMAAGEHKRWWPLLVGGLFGIAAGVLTFVQPAATALALVYVIGAWAIVTGALEIVAAIRLRKVITNECRANRREQRRARFAIAWRRS